MISNELQELISQAQAMPKTPSRHVGTVVEKIGTSNYEVSISISKSGWADYSFNKVKGGIRKKLSRRKIGNDVDTVPKRRGILDFPDGGGLCITEHLPTAIAEAKKRLEQKETSVPRIKD